MALQRFVDALDLCRGSSCPAPPKSATNLDTNDFEKTIVVPSILHKLPLRVMRMTILALLRRERV